MPQRTKYFEDFTKLMSGAFGLAKGARQEMQTVATSLLDRMLADRQLVSREEFEVVRDLAREARDGNREILDKLDQLQAQGEQARRAEKSERAPRAERRAPRRASRRAAVDQTAAVEPPPREEEKKKPGRPKSKAPVKKVRKKRTLSNVEYRCPIDGCTFVFKGSRSGWDRHILSMGNHPNWHPDVTDREERKRLFREEFPQFFA